MHIQLDPEVQVRLMAHLEAAYPNEGGGFLLGMLTAETVSITDLVPVKNVFSEEEQHHRYAMTPRDWADLEDEADARGLTLVGYFHSHPDSPAIPSVYDRDHALPNFTYLISAVYEAKAEAPRAWRLRPDRSAFDEETLTPA